MADKRTTTQVFYEGWKDYMDSIKRALAPLSQEQLRLRAAPEERSVGEMAQHIVAARAGWFHDFMGVGGEEIAAFSTWDEPGEPERSAEEVVRGLDATWDFMAGLLDHWSPEDMQFTFPNEWRGEHYDLPRSWVTWHVLEHDLIHGGEVSLTLGMHGLEAPRP